MRLNQLAKKVGKPYTRIEKFLVKECGMTEVDGPNTKVSNDIIDKVIYKFGLAEDNKGQSAKKVVLKTVEAVEAQISPEEKGIEEAEISFNAPTPAESVKPVIELDDVKMSNKVTAVSEDVTEEEEEEDTKEKSEIDSEKVSLGQEETAKNNIITVETEEATFHFDKEDVIKAPKVELEGIKVMGKINLPKPKKTEDHELVDSEEGLDEITNNSNFKEEDVDLKTPNIIPKPQKKTTSQEELDTRRAKRIEAKKKLESALIEKENKALKKKEKDAKKQYYAQQDKAAPKIGKKKNTKVSHQSEENKAFETKEKYKTPDENLSLYQKIVRWFNT